MSTFESFEQATEALDAAMAADGMENGNVSETLSPDLPFNPSNEGPPQGLNTPSDAATPQDPAPAAPSVEPFTEKFDPTTLPPELLPAYKSMQADYTRKTQAIAEQGRQYEQYGDLDIETAAQLMQRVSTPQGLQAFVQEAQDWLVEEGFTPAEARQAVADMQQPQDPANDPFKGLDALVQSDPELAPLAQAVQALQQQVSGFEHQQSERLAAEREQAEALQALGEIQRMENFIRNEHPEYQDSDIESIYELAAYHDGNLIEAQESYEAMFANRLGRYLQSKNIPAQQPGVQPLGSPSNAGPPANPDYDPLDPNQAHEAAMEVLRVIEAAAD